MCAAAHLPRSAAWAVRDCGVLSGPRPTPSPSPSPSPTGLPAEPDCKRCPVFGKLLPAPQGHLCSQRALLKNLRASARSVPIFRTRAQAVKTPAKPPRPLGTQGAAPCAPGVAGRQRAVWNTTRNRTGRSKTRPKNGKQDGKRANRRFTSSIKPHSVVHFEVTAAARTDSALGVEAGRKTLVVQTAVLNSPHISYLANCVKQPLLAPLTRNEITLQILVED